MKSGHKSSRSQLGIHSSRIHNCSRNLELISELCSREPGSRVRTMTGEPKSESHEVSALFSVKRLQLDNSDTSGPGDMFHSNITLSQVTDTAVASASQVKVQRAGTGLHIKTAEKFRFNPALYEGQPMKTYLMQFKGNQTDTGFAKSFNRPAQVSAFTSATGQTGGQDSSPKPITPHLIIYSLRGIEKFVHLQNIDVSNNKITDLEPLNGLNVLIRINAANNLISSLKHFNPAEVLVFLHLGFNRLNRIPDLSNYYETEIIDKFKLLQ